MNWVQFVLLMESQGCSLALCLLPFKKPLFYYLFNTGIGRRQKLIAKEYWTQQHIRFQIFFENLGCPTTPPGEFLVEGGSL